MSGAGFDVADTGNAFAHRVDRAITRDVMVATTT